MSFSTAIAPEAGPFKADHTYCGHYIFIFLSGPAEPRGFATLFSKLLIPVGNNKFINKGQKYSYKPRNTLPLKERLGFKDELVKRKWVSR